MNFLSTNQILPELQKKLNVQYKSYEEDDDM